MARTPQDPQVRINEILDVADELFFSKGYQATTISDISKKMGVAQGMLYYYFKSKEVLLERLLDRYAASLVQEVKVIFAASQSPTAKIALTVSALLRKAVYKDGLLLKMLYDDQNLHLKMQLFNQLETALSPWLLRMVEEGTENGEFVVAHPPTAVDYILVMVDFLSLALYQKISDEVLSYRLQMAQTLIEKTLGAKEGSIVLLDVKP